MPKKMTADEIIPKPEPMTQVEKDGRYRSYARGWHDGATRTTAPIGTPEPRYPDEYERGEREGRCAHDAAMKARFEALTQA